ncbi:MAG: HD domain-containing protein [Phycisphaerales bacterium]|nr:HD domain-containing protein [Phycisphaerales bacterium]
MAEKLIRDPVHDVIAFRVHREEDALLFRLINAAEFQRLRRIRQLGMASLAYPGADHSRYSHSLGVLETARRMLDRLADAFPISPEDRLACLAAALLHDLGHGPFSHVFERVSGIRHERVTRQTILDPLGEVNQVLGKADPSLPARVAAMLDGQGPQYVRDILSSQLDADRLDYLLRDNLMTGCRYGEYDLRWLLQALTLDPASRRLAVQWKGVSAVEAYLQARYHMYRNVYFHKVVRAAEGMVKLALQRASRLAVQDRLPWPDREHPVCKTLRGHALNHDEFQQLDDVSVLQCFKAWENCEDATLARLCRGLLCRKLYKTFDLTHLSTEDAAHAVRRAGQAIERAGGDPTYDAFFDEVADTPYQTYAPDARDQSSEIMVCAPDGRLTPFAAISPAAAAMNRQLIFRRLHVAEPYRNEVATALKLH